MNLSFFNFIDLFQYGDLYCSHIGKLPVITLYLKKNYFSWRLITLQYCSGFCHTLIWISHGFTCIPLPEPLSHLPPHPMPLGHPYLMHWKNFIGASKTVQRLRLHASIAGSTDLIPRWGTKIPHDIWCSPTQFFYWSIADLQCCVQFLGFPNGSAGKNSICNAGAAGDVGLILGLEDHSPRAKQPGIWSQVDLRKHHYEQS